MAGQDFTEPVEALQAATRVLAGVALRSLGVFDGVITLPQFRMLAVLAELGCVRSAGVARALGLDASTVTRLADRLVAAGHVERGSDPRHRSVVDAAADVERVGPRQHGIRVAAPRAEPDRRRASAGHP